MAESTIEGTGGAVSLPTGWKGKIQSWSADLQVKDVETSGFVDAGNHTYAPVAIGLTGSVKAIGIQGAAGDTPAPPTLTGATPDLSTSIGTLLLTAKSGCTYGGSAIITNNKMQRNWDGAFEMTFDFKITGAITQTWAVA